MKTKHHINRNKISKNQISKNIAFTILSITTALLIILGAPGAIFLSIANLPFPLFGVNPMKDMKDLAWPIAIYLSFFWIALSIIIKITHTLTSSKTLKKSGWGIGIFTSAFICIVISFITLLYQL